AEREPRPRHRALRLHHGRRPHRPRGRSGEGEEQRGRQGVLPGGRRARAELPGGEELSPAEEVAVVKLENLGWLKPMSCSAVLLHRSVERRRVLATTTTTGIRHQGPRTIFIRASSACHLVVGLS